MANFSTITPEKKEMLTSMALEFMNRLNAARRGCHNSNDWDDEDENAGAPTGMCYDEWIDESFDILINNIRSL